MCGECGILSSLRAKSSGTLDGVACSDDNAALYELERLSGDVDDGKGDDLREKEETLTIPGREEPARIPQFPIAALHDFRDGGSPATGGALTACSSSQQSR